MSTPTFKDGVCAKFGCKPEDYAASVFWHCLYPHARLAAKIMWGTKFFQQDLDLIADIATTDAWSIFRRELEVYRYHNPPNGILRDLLRIRVSTHRLSKLAYELLPPHPPGWINTARRSPQAQPSDEPLPAYLTPTNPPVLTPLTSAGLPFGSLPTTTRSSSAG